jgi:hypothetical protein
MILREGKTPTGVEVRTILKHVIALIRRHWPKVGILVRGDSHYGRSEAMVGAMPTALTTSSGSAAIRCCMIWCDLSPMNCVCDVR